MLPGIDGRSLGARRYREVVYRLCTEISGGKRRVTSTEEYLARRAAFLIIWCEEAEAKKANGEAVDVGEFADVTNVLRRTLVDAGLILTPSQRAHI